MGLGLAIAMGVPLVFGIGAVLFVLSRIKKDAIQERADNEASFARAFPDLHPHFHPSSVLDYVLAQHGRFWWARTAQHGDHWRFVRGPELTPTPAARGGSAA